VGRLSMTTLKVSHLFADGTTVFCDNDNDRDQMVNLRCVLTWFQAVLGPWVNLAKSSILPVGEIDNIAGVLGGNIKAFLSTYLVLPLSAKFKEGAVWDPIIVKFEK